MLFSVSPFRGHRAVSLWLVLTALALLLTAGCGPSAAEKKADPERLPVAATFYPMAEFVRQVGGDHVQVTTLVPDGTEPHDWEPKASDLGTMAASRLFLYNGGVEGWVPQALASIGKGKVNALEAGRGLIQDGDDFTTFIDIQGVEDFHGEMDFKVAGTKKGITAIQMDLKNDGLTMAIIKNALEITYDARVQILDQIMLPCISEPRAEVSQYAPKMITMHIDPERIREVIGKGGSVIQKIVAESGAKIDIDDDGTIHIASPDAESCAIAKKCIDDIVFVPEVGALYYGRVVRLMQFGAFVEIAPGVEGLIHVSEMSWSQHLRSAQEFMKVGDEVEAVILTLDREERKMSLGIKQLTPDPWADIETRYPVGTKCKAKVRNFTNFGVFVEIEEGIDGLIHISDLSWTKKIKHPGEFTSVGAEIEVVVLEVDKENRRLSLGHKQLEENPWNEFEGQFSVDSVHKGTITEMTDKGAIVSLGENVEGFAPMRQLVKEDGTTATVGEKLPFKVIEFSKATKRITLSHTRLFEEAKRAERAEQAAERKASAEATKSSVKKINASVEKTTLGDIAGLAELKDAMEAAAKEEK